MTSESYLDPIAKLTDPKKLRTKQFMRKMNWNTIILFFWLLAIVCPVVFAFQSNNIAQILKICYIPLSIMASGILFNFKPLSLWVSNVFYFVPFAITLAPIAIVTTLIPEPTWFQVVIPIQFIIYWKVNRDIPRRTNEEWRMFKERNGYTSEDIEQMLKQN